MQEIFFAPENNGRNARKAVSAIQENAGNAAIRVERPLCQSARSGRQQKKGNEMAKKKSTGIDWMGLAKAVIKAALPFLTGAIGGFLAGCSVTGSGIGFTA